MNAVTNLITTTNGTIITVIKMHHRPSAYALIGLALAGLVCLGAGLYLLLRKEKSKLFR